MAHLSRITALAAGISRMGASVLVLVVWVAVLNDCPGCLGVGVLPTQRVGGREGALRERLAGSGTGTSAPPEADWRPVVLTDSSLKPSPSSPAPAPPRDPLLTASSSRSLITVRTPPYAAPVSAQDFRPVTSSAKPAIVAASDGGGGGRAPREDRPYSPTWALPVRPVRDDADDERENDLDDGYGYRSQGPRPSPTAPFWERAASPRLLWQRHAPAPLRVVVDLLGQGGCRWDLLQGLHHLDPAQHAPPATAYGLGAYGLYGWSLPRHHHNTAPLGALRGSGGLGGLGGLGGVNPN